MYTYMHLMLYIIKINVMIYYIRYKIYALI